MIAFAFGTAGGVLLGKLLCKLTKGRINPLIGSAGVSAVPMAARVSQKVGSEADPSNFLLMDVTFGYDEHVVLDHLNLKVMDAEQVTLAGRTGAGKSTILKLLLGLYEPQGGEVLIHGRPAAAVREEEK